ncbi:MAG: exodeoxyribonuclease VII small subunit [Deltaproteobacteria bacterium]|nr:exodeoxyribonuclease VII small subunit [Deltaproteobacteria bacterium]
MKKNTKPNLPDMPFEEAMKTLEKIVDELEDGNIPLEQSLDHFEEGMRLAQLCEKKLDEASGRVEKIVKDLSGKEKIITLDEGELQALHGAKNDV